MAQTGKPKHPTALAQHTNRGTCLLDQPKLCTAKRVPREALPIQKCVKKNCHFTFAVASQMMQLKLFSTCSHDVSSNGLCITKDTSRHCNSRNAVQCAPTTDAIAHERRLCERLVKTTSKKKLSFRNRREQIPFELFLSMAAE